MTTIREEIDKRRRLKFKEQEKESERLTLAYAKALIAPNPQSAVRPPQFTPAELLDIISERGKLLLQIERKKEPVFSIDKYNGKVLEWLILYFTNNPKFNEINPAFDLGKGLWLEGSVGLGKTFLFRLFTNITPVGGKRPAVIDNRMALLMHGWPDKAHFENGVVFSRIFPCVDLEAESRDPKKNVVAKHSDPGHLWPAMYDDLGNEERRAFMSKLLELRYRRMTEYGVKTHITTNIVDDEVLKSTIKGYGPRVYDRMGAMFNRIQLAGKSRRK